MIVVDDDDDDDDDDVSLWSWWWYIPYAPMKTRGKHELWWLERFLLLINHGDDEIIIIAIMYVSNLTLLISTKKGGFGYSTSTHTYSHIHTTKPAKKNNNNKIHYLCLIMSTLVGSW